MYAREFAACLLMPEEDVKILADLRMDDLEMALRFMVASRSDADPVEDLGMRTPI